MRKTLYKLTNHYIKSLFFIHTYKSALKHVISLRESYKPRLLKTSVNVRHTKTYRNAQAINSEYSRKGGCGNAGGVAGERRGTAGTGRPRAGPANSIPTGPNSKHLHHIHALNPIAQRPFSNEHKRERQSMLLKQDNRSFRLRSGDRNDHGENSQISYYYSEMNIILISQSIPATRASRISLGNCIKYEYCTVLSAIYR